jgi:Bacterial Ig domain
MSRFHLIGVVTALALGLSGKVPAIAGGPPLNTCPTATPQAITVDQGGTVSFTLQGFDLDGNSLTFAITAPPAKGTLVVNTQTGAASYTSTDGCGLDSFQFTVSDGLCTSAAATVSITVTDSTPPEVVCSEDITRPATSQSGAVVTYVASCSDSCGLQSLACAPPSGSTFPIGQTTVTCTCEDSAEIQSSCSFAVTVEGNECPTADPLALAVAQNGTVNFQLTGSDPDADPIQFSVTQPPAHGVVVLQVATGAASYTPAPGYCGPDSFKFKVSDGQCMSAEATVSIDVACPPPLLGCRVTGGAVTTAGETSPDYVFETLTAMGVGQVGASCGSVGCFDEGGHIQGVWQHSLKKRKANFRSRRLTSLACSCMDGTTGALAFGAPCNPGDPSGPEPRPAPANVACFAGTGLYKRTIPAAFRVEVEDHGEPGANTDKYRIRIWIPQGQETVDALAEGACCCNPSPTGAAARRPNIDDGSNLIHGDIQIHPLTPAEHEGCPVPDPACRICGNGVVDGNEECDPPDSTCRGGTNPVTGITTDFRCTQDCTCPDPECGDEFVDAGEECDPPGSTCGDGHSCLGDCTCQPGVCGDGILDPGEQCEPPDTLGGCGDQSCDSNCQCVSECGNDEIELGEDCDPPAPLGCGDQSCDPTCHCVSVCGDGVIEAGEQCEPPNRGCGEQSCDPTTCQCVSVCGNGIPELGEQCDPPSTVGGCPGGLQSCDATCQCVSECGNGLTEVGEGCDPPSTLGGCFNGEASCNASCQCYSECGNGYVEEDGGESCDPPNVSLSTQCFGAFRACNANCECSSFCGNGELEFGEACDPPGSACETSGTCSSDCTTCVPQPEPD